MLKVGPLTSRPLIRLYKEVNVQCSCNAMKLTGRQAKKETLYDVLEVEHSATVKEIKQSYLRLCKQYHPDSNSENKSLHDKFVKINEAYSVLCRPHDRQMYDKALKAGLNPEPGEVNTVENWNPNHIQFYYHPKFYKDPKMREAAAKAWEADTGWSYAEYYEDYDAVKLTPNDRRRGIGLSLILMLVGCLLAVRVYLAAVESASNSRRQAAQNVQRQNIQRTYAGNRRGVNVQKLDDETHKVNEGGFDKDFEFLYPKEK